MYVKHQLYKEWFFTGTGFFYTNPEVAFYLEL